MPRGCDGTVVGLSFGVMCQNGRRHWVHSRDKEAGKDSIQSTQAHGMHVRHLCSGDGYLRIHSMPKRIINSRYQFRTVDDSPRIAKLRPEVLGAVDDTQGSEPAQP